jgi:hypothetical protein
MLTASAARDRNGNAAATPAAITPLADLRKSLRRGRVRLPSPCDLGIVSSARIVRFCCKPAGSSRALRIVYNIIFNIANSRFAD